MAILSRVWRRPERPGQAAPGASAIYGSRDVAEPMPGTAVPPNPTTPSGGSTVRPGGEIPGEPPGDRSRRIASFPALSLDEGGAQTRARPLDARAEAAPASTTPLSGEARLPVASVAQEMPPPSPLPAPAAAKGPAKAEDDLMDVFAEEEAVDSPLHNLAVGLEEVEVYELSRECREVTNLLKKHQRT